MTESTECKLTHKKYPVLQDNDKIIIDEKLYVIVYINRAHYILKELYE